MTDVTKQLIQERDRAKNERDAARAEVAKLNDKLHRKNVKLDALHFVWCDGGCASGVHRFDHGELTEEIVAEAERNALRLRRWLANKDFKTQWAAMSQGERNLWFSQNTPNQHKGGQE